ncbi:hypothetical protein BH10PLA2_BH10PLA2_32600 [soil metagenome]
MRGIGRLKTVHVPAMKTERCFESILKTDCRAKPFSHLQD